LGNTIGAVAYPDLCGIECANTWGSTDWEMAASGECDDSLMFPGCWQVWAPSGDSHVANVSLRKPYARHLGGVNLGFLDGHAAWMNSEALLAKWSEEAVRRSSAGGEGHAFAYEGMGIFSAGPTPWTGVGCDCPEWDTMPHLVNYPRQ
jgi:prepilin-type processing-associated H-X9-DG protein